MDCDNNNLINVPTGVGPGILDELEKKADKVVGAVDGDLAELTSAGNLKDGNKKLEYDSDLDELITTVE